MAEIATAGAFPCRVDDQSVRLKGSHVCHAGAGVLGPSWQWSNPGRCAPDVCAARDLDRQGVTPGFNFGVLLLPYILDWGDTRGLITRRKLYPTALKAFPRARDRVYGFASAQAFVSTKDRYINRFAQFLIGLPPFAGWRWFPELLQKWLDLADGLAAGYGEPGSLTTDDAFNAAMAFSGPARALWEQLTIERWPYDVPSLMRYWHRGERPAALS